MADLPPWLTRSYDPVGTFLRAFQTGSEISMAQTRLQEQQRQANMEHMAKQQALQSNMARAVADLAVKSEYEQQQLALQNAQLEETKRRNDAIAQNAAADVAERQQYHEALAQHNQEMERLRGEEVTARVGAAEAGKIHFGPKGEVLQAMPDGTVKELRGAEKDTALHGSYDPAVKQMRVTGPLGAVQEYIKAQEERKKESGEGQGSGFLGDIFRMGIQAGFPAMRYSMPWHQAAPPVTPGPKRDSSALRAEAEKAIADGAPRDAVAARFKQMTGEEL